MNAYRDAIRGVAAFVVLWVLALTAYLGDVSAAGQAFVNGCIFFVAGSIGGTVVSAPVVLAYHFWRWRRAGKPGCLRRVLVSEALPLSAACGVTVFLAALLLGYILHGGSFDPECAPGVPGRYC